jgi:hypothetical protein
VFRERLAESIEGCAVFEHRQFAVGVAGVVPGTELDGIDPVGFQLLEDFTQRELGQQGSKYASSHHPSLANKKTHVWPTVGQAIVFCRLLFGMQGGRPRMTMARPTEELRVH